MDVRIIDRLSRLSCVGWSAFILAQDLGKGVNRKDCAIVCGIGSAVKRVRNVHPYRIDTTLETELSGCFSDTD